LYFQNQLKKYQSNLKKTWQTLRKAMNLTTSKDNSINKILVNNEFISDPKNMADQFNLYFSNIANDVVSNINPILENTGPVLPNDDVHVNNFSFAAEPVTCNEIAEAAASLKDKATQDFRGLSSIFVKKIVLSISNPLKHL
jgi:hypothetical protein